MSIIMQPSGGLPKIIFRLSVNPLPPAEQHDLPFTADVNDFDPLQGGGYFSKEPVSIATTDDDQMVGITYRADDPLVRIDNEEWFNGYLFRKTGAGNGVDPFPINNPPDFGSVTMQYSVRHVGDWEFVMTLKYQSGRIEMYRHEYVVTGPNKAVYEDKELYVGGLGVPEYKEDWQTIADFWDGRNESKRIVAQAKADAADPKPTGASHPYQFPLNQLTNPPADLQGVINIATSGLTAADDGINAYEALARTNPDQARDNELAHYSAIVNSWSQLYGTTTNPNLKAVAQQNVEWTLYFTRVSEAAYLGDRTFEEADSRWRGYQQYSQYFLTAPADKVVDVRTWEIVLGRPPVYVV